MNNYKDYKNNQDDSMNNESDYYIETGIQETKVYLKSQRLLYSLKKDAWVLPVYDTLTGKPIMGKMQEKNNSVELWIPIKLDDKDGGDKVDVLFTRWKFALLDTFLYDQVKQSILSHIERYRDGTVPIWTGKDLSFDPKPANSTSALSKRELELAFQNIFYKNINRRFIILFELEKATHFLKVASQICNPFFVMSNPSPPFNFENGNSDNGNGPVLEMGKPILVIVTEKTNSLVLEAQSYQDVELVLATELNVVSLLEATQCIVSYDAAQIIYKEYFQYSFFAGEGDIVSLQL